MVKSVAEIFAARIGQRLCLNSGVAGFADFDGSGGWGTRTRVGNF